LTVLELDRPLAQTPPPAPRRPLGRPRPRGETASVVGDDVPVELRYRGQGGRQRLGGSGRMYADAAFAAVLAVADPLVLLTVSSAGHAASHWAFVPGGPSVTARADALRLLRAMRADGDLVMRVGADEELPALELAGADTWTRGDEEEWQLFEDLAALEEWSGQSVPVPGALSGDEVARIAPAAAWPAQHASRRR